MGLFYFFGFSLNGIPEIIIAVIEAISLIIFCISLFLTLFLLIIKKGLIFDRDLKKIVTRKLIISRAELDKNYTTLEKIFVANIWNNSLKSESSLSMLFFLGIFKNWYPNLYQILLFSISLVIPACVPDHLRNKNNQEYKKCMKKGFGTHWGEINKKILEKFDNRIRTFTSFIIGFTIILLIISFAFQTWIVILIEIIIILFGLYDMIRKNH
jgi:hypothetical protein